MALCKRRGFVYPTSEIYGGFVSSYDYGPVGAELLRNIRNLWWKYFISDREDMVGLDSQIILHPKTWEASGHVANFSDPIVECKFCHRRFRADQIDLENFKCENCGGTEITEPKNFNLLFETSIGVVENEKAKAYLRGETAQGIFSNFKNIVDSNRVSLPFGVGQIGKSFRNEITTGQFIFRTLEFEQAEIEYFFDPAQTDWQTLMDLWKESMLNFVTKNLGIKPENLRFRRHTDKERSHYSKDTYDLDYNFPFGWKELWGIAYRTDYDLKQHQKFSGVDLGYNGILPHVIEPAVGITRLFFMILVDAYSQEENRIVLKLDPKVAPYKVAIFPLVHNKPELVSKAREIYSKLKQHFMVVWDDRGNIGKRYLAQDEIGTPWCVTVDYQSLEDGTVTVRDRDTTTQERVLIDKLTEYFQNKLQ